MTRTADALPPRTYDVWWRHVGPAASRLAGSLAPGERHRIGGLRRDVDRRRALLAGVLHRLVAACYGGTSPTAVQIPRCCRRCGGRTGKPLVRVAGAIQEASVSHGGDLVGSGY
jgi:hypothetical protein